MKINRIKETCLYSRDLHTARAFYEGKLGLKCFSFVEGRFAFFRAGESVLLVFDPDFSKNQTGLPPHWSTGAYHFAFEVAQEDYQAWKEEQHSFYFNDPDGHVLEIVMSGLWDY